MEDKERISLFDTGEFYESLENKTIHTAKNKAGGTVVVGFSDNDNQKNREMTNNKFLTGIKIISSNMPKDQGNQHGIQGLHDQFWFGKKEWVTDPIDIKYLNQLGWFIDEGSWSCNP